MIGLTLTMLAMQPVASESPAAPVETETLEIEYPIVIEPYIGDYQDCLKSGTYEMGFDSSFEEEYRKDIPRCDAVAADLVPQAKARLASWQAEGQAYEYDADVIFEKARQIHLWRARNLDRSMVTEVSTSSPDAHMVKAVAACRVQLKSLREEREAFAETEGAKVEPIHAKSRYTKDDQRAMFTYQNQLARYSTRLSFEMRRCLATSQQSGTSLLNAPNN